jgi:hypothetical protein
MPLDPPRPPKGQTCQGQVSPPQSLPFPRGQSSPVSGPGPRGRDLAVSAGFAIPPAPASALQCPRSPSLLPRPLPAPLGCRRAPCSSSGLLPPENQPGNLETTLPLRSGFCPEPVREERGGPARCGRRFSPPPAPLHPRNTHFLGRRQAAAPPVTPPPRVSPRLPHAAPSGAANQVPALRPAPG